MRAAGPFALVLVLVLVLAGCVSNKVAPAAVPELKAATAYGVLANAQKPAGAIVAPTFKLLGAVAKGGPAYGDGEPSISTAMDGTLYVSFPGCDQGIGPVALFFGSVAGQPSCDAGVVYASADVGRTWKRLNADNTGKLASDAPAANGDADIAVDANGTIYVSNLGGGVETQRSDDGGKTWNYTGNVVPKGERSVDRNWLAAAGPGHVIHNWMGGNKDKPRSVGVNTTWDGGRTWSGTTYLGDNIGWEGSVQFAKDGETAYIPFTQGEGPETPVSGQQDRYHLLVAKTIDGGHNWTIIDTNATIARATTSFHFSGMMLAPALGVTGDGHVVYAYAEEETSPGNAANVGGVVKLIASADNGTTWGKPITISTAPSAIFPWVAAGAGDRIAITYFADNLPGDPDRTGMWDLHAAMLDVGAEAPKVVDSIVEANVHVGGICSSGSVCLFSGGDRGLLDYFENTVTPDGKIAIVYPADPAEKGKYIEIRVAVQDEGSRMLIR